MATRLVRESPVERGVAEEYPYKFTLTDKFPSGTYNNPQTALYSRDTDGKDFTTAVAGALTGTADITAGVFTTQNFVADVLTAGETYRLHCIMDVDGLQWDWELYIHARN